MTPNAPANLPFCATVYSLVWPTTENLVRRCLRDEADIMLNQHQDAFTKQQDDLHLPFFQAWKDFASSCVRVHWDGFPEMYPTAGSSEAIREIIRQARWQGQDLVVFDGDYEGYEAIAIQQGTPVVRVDRDNWREQLRQWKTQGVPWGPNGAQWWISQPSAMDGNVWGDFNEWLGAMQEFQDVAIWVDLTYVGRAIMPNPIDLQAASTVAGVVFSLSKVMGAYYRRIGGCLSRAPVSGLWANRWFKNLDSLFLGQRWLAMAQCAKTEGARYRDTQAQAMQECLAYMGGSAWTAAGITWKASDVCLLMHASPIDASVPPDLDAVWSHARRGVNKPASRRLCLTPAMSRILRPANTFKGPV